MDTEEDKHQTQKNKQTSSFFLQKNSNQVILTSPNIRRCRYSHNNQVFSSIKRATSYLDISHQDHKVVKKEDTHQHTKKHQVFFFFF